MTAQLSIDTLPLDDGRLALCRLPGLGDALERDLDAMQVLGVDLILSLIEPEELQRLGLSDLHGAFDARGFAWRAFPIPDFGNPQDDSAWAIVSMLAHDVIGHGGTVLIHCRAGLGRSGMIALRLLVERGEAPDAALARLRAARPGAVETEAQRLWATRLA